jgi:hypothetical protein
MDDFQKFQAEAIEKIRERLAPNWEPPNSEKELPFNLSKADWQWLEGNVLLKLPCILEMSTEQLLDSFPKERGRTLIIRTFIWQCWLLIQMGLMKPLQGTLRSLWYRDLEGFMRIHGLVEDGDEATRASDVDSDEDRIVEIMREQIGLFVEHRIFRYSGAFQFVPIFNSKYYIGRNRYGWFFFTEKVGLWETTCKNLYADKKWSCTVMASQGEPSGLTMERLGIDLRHKKVKTLIQFTFSDRDPWGWWIDASLDAYMRRLGFEVQTWRLTTEDLFTEADANGSKDYTAIIEKCKDPSYKPTSKEKLISNWFKLSNGWRGRPVALHCDKIPEEVRNERIQAFLKELKKDKPNPALFPGTLVKPAVEARLLEIPALIAPKRLRNMFR